MIGLGEAGKGGRGRSERLLVSTFLEKAEREKETAPGKRSGREREIVSTMAGELLPGACQRGRQRTMVRVHVCIPASS